MNQVSTVGNSSGFIASNDRQPRHVHAWNGCQSHRHGQEHHPPGDQARHHLARPTADGRGYEIDPAELHGVYSPVASNGSAEPAMEQSVTPPLNAGLELRLVRAEAELEALRQLLESERRRSEELRVERNDWKGQAERLALAPPQAVAAQPARRGWWPWRRSA